MGACALTYIPVNEMEGSWCYDFTIEAGAGAGARVAFVQNRLAIPLAGRITRYVTGIVCYLLRQESVGAGCLLKLVLKK